MSINKDRRNRLLLFSVIALFTLLLIGSVEAVPRQQQNVSSEVRNALSAVSDTPAASRATWQTLAEKNPQLMLQICQD